MGMDIYGKNPTNDIGIYFRNNVWFWHPLWDYCSYVSPMITAKAPNAHCNSGDGLNAADSKVLSKLIKLQIKNGITEKYIKEYYTHMESLPKEKCFCVKDSKALFAGIVYTPEGKIPFPKDMPPNENCTSCNGTGLCEPFEKSYHITLENIQEFSDFLEHCGGFSIC